MVKNAEGMRTYQQEIHGFELIEVYLVTCEHEPSRCKYGQKNYRRMSGIHIIEVPATSARIAFNNASVMRCIDIHPEDGCQSVLRNHFPKYKKSSPKGLSVPI